VKRQLTGNEGILTGRDGFISFQKGCF